MIRHRLILCFASPLRRMYALNYVFYFSLGFYSTKWAVMAVKELGRLKGLVPATFTPLSPNGELNLELIPEYVKHLASNGIEYIFINGTTGEGPSFTVEERKKLAEVWIKRSRNVLKGVMVHVGAGNSVSLLSGF